MFDLVLLDLVFICNVLVCICLFFCVSLDNFGFVFSNFVLFGLVSSLPSQDIQGKNVSEMTYFVSSGT